MKIQLQPGAIMIILLLRLCFAEVQRNKFAAITHDNCICRGYNVTYECTVFGNGATIWRGTAIDCPLTNNELIIFHSNYTLQTCSNNAIIGRTIRNENSSHTSELVVQISDETNGKTIVCDHDSGSAIANIGSAILNISMVPFPPPTDIQLVEANNTHLIFNWTPVSLSCPSIRYQIMASNCGQCPAATYNNTVTCKGNYTQYNSDQQCVLALRTVVCDNIIGPDGDISITVTIPIADSEGPEQFQNVTDEDILDAGQEFVTGLIVSAIIVPVMVLMGITLILGLVVAIVYLRSRPKNTATHQRSMPTTNMVENVVDNEQIQGIGIYCYLQSTDSEDQDQNPNSGSTGGIIYADLSSNTIKAVDICQQNLMLLSNDDRVQYEEIRHKEEGTPVCIPSASDKVLVNLDFLLILLKEKLTQRWYEFGLVIGIPKDIMDGYVGYPPDQCLIEVLDYWLRHHPGHLTWKEVAQVLREIKFYELAEKALQISTSGKFPLETEITSHNQMEDAFNHNQMVSKNIPNHELNSGINNKSLSSDTVLPHKQHNLGTTQHTSTLSESDDDSASTLSSPPPLPPKCNEIIHTNI